MKSFKSRVVVFSVLFCGCFGAGIQASAQLRDYLNLPDHDSKKYYIGIGFMYTSSHLQVTAHPKLLQSDSILYVTPGNSGGFGVSGMFTFRLAEHFEFRFAFPEFIFANNSLAYHVSHPPAGEDSLATKQIQSLLLGFPAQVKFLSDPIHTLRLSLLGGFTYRSDFPSNS